MSCWEEKGEMSARRTLRHPREGSQLDKRCRALEVRIELFTTLQKKRYAALNGDLLQLAKEVQDEHAALEQHAQERAAAAATLFQRFEQALEAARRAQEELKQQLLEGVTARVQAILNDREAQAEARSLTSKQLGQEAQADLRRLTEGFQGLESEREAQAAAAVAQFAGAVQALRGEFDAAKHLHAQLNGEVAEEIHRLKAAVQAETQAEFDRRAATEQRVLLLLEAACDKIDALA